MWIGRNTFGFLVTHAFVRFFVISVGEKLFSVSVEGVLLATLMILVDVAVVWCIEKTVPEVIGLKRKKRIIRN